MRLKNVVTTLLMMLAIFVLAPYSYGQNYPTGYAGATVSITAASSFTVSVTNQAIVTVTTGTRVVVHDAQFICNSDVSVAVTMSLGFGTATLPTVGAGLIWSNVKTDASKFQGISKGAGWPNVVARGSSNEDLRLTMTVPTGGACSYSINYSTEATR